MCPPKGITPLKSQVHLSLLLDFQRGPWTHKVCLFLSQKSTLCLVIFVAICLDLQCTETYFSGHLTEQRQPHFLIIFIISFFNLTPKTMSFNTNPRQRLLVEI